MKKIRKIFLFLCSFSLIVTSLFSSFTVHGASVVESGLYWFPNTADNVYWYIGVQGAGSGNFHDTSSNFRFMEVAYNWKVTFPNSVAIQYGYIDDTGTAVSFKETFTDDLSTNPQPYLMYFLDTYRYDPGSVPSSWIFLPGYIYEFYVWYHVIFDTYTSTESTVPDGPKTRGTLYSIGIGGPDGTLSLFDKSMNRGSSYIEVIDTGFESQIARVVVDMTDATKKFSFTDVYFNNGPLVAEVPSVPKFDMTGTLIFSDVVVYETDLVNLNKDPQLDDLGDKLDELNQNVLGNDQPPITPMPPKDVAPPVNDAEAVKGASNVLNNLSSQIDLYSGNGGSFWVSIVNSMYSWSVFSPFVAMAVAFILIRAVLGR